MPGPSISVSGAMGPLTQPIDTHMSSPEHPSRRGASAPPLSTGSGRYHPSHATFDRSLAFLSELTALTLSQSELPSHIEGSSTQATGDSISARQPYHTEDIVEPEDGDEDADAMDL